MKKPICRLLVLLAIVTWPTICQALPNETGEFTKLGVGNLECGLWTQARKTGDVYATLILSWFQGFLTSYNLYGPETLDMTREADLNEVGGWVDHYCVEHPTNNIARAAEALVAAFQKPRKR
jgi:hypothetical protein